MDIQQLNLPEYLVLALQKQEISELTTIQERAIPPILDGKDVIGKSKTGSGKTYAFAIPAMLMVDVDRKVPQILVIAPTRELAGQQTDEIRKLNEFREGCNVTPLVGGAHMERQIQTLKKGVKVVVGTPGRLCDHLKRRTLDLSEIKLVIIDEADEMLDMGFRNELETILNKTPATRQTALFSATMSDEIKEIAQKYLKNPIIIETELGNNSDFIDQYFVRVSLKAKNMAIRELIDDLKPATSIIFCNTKKMVDSLFESLQTNGYLVCKLHSDVRQSERKSTISAFKNGEIPILIATDVASRGIDVSGLDVVFNFDVPETSEYYTHRIGRTGRAGKPGKAYTLINTAYQREKFDEILKVTDNTVFEHKSKFTVPDTVDDVATRKARREKYLDQAREKVAKKRAPQKQAKSKYHRFDEKQDTFKKSGKFSKQDSKYGKSKSSKQNFATKSTQKKHVSPSRLKHDKYSHKKRPK